MTRRLLLNYCYNSLAWWSKLDGPRTELYKKLSVDYHTTKCFNSVKSYKKHTSRQVDPRKNVQYRHVPGDPQQDEIVKRLENHGTLSMLKETDRQTDNRKRQKLQNKKDIFETASGLKIERLKENDIRLGRAMMEAKTKHTRTEVDTILLEGQRLIRDALLLGAKAKGLYFCDPAILEGFPSSLLKDVGLFKILYRDLKVWSDTVTPAGILGVFSKPQQGEVVSESEATLPLTLILDSVKDPGNAGTLIRTASAVGCQRVISVKGSVNVWDCKVLRSAMGGHFSVPIYSGISWADVPNYLEDSTQVFLANSQQTDTLMESFDENLQSDDLEDENEISESESKLESENIGEKDAMVGNNADVFQNIPLPVYEYSKITLNNLAKENGSVSVALIVGSETEGLSIQAKKFAYKYYGQYVSIPMRKSIESLNTAVAGSVILYELRKKFTENNVDKER